MKEGYYSALGTPVDQDGKLIETSFEKQVDMLISANTAGLLCMGTMGNMAAIRNSEYPRIAKICVKAVAGRVPVMVGVMDCSVGRVLDRIEALGNIEIDGVVATAPFYNTLNQKQLISFFTILGERSRYPLYLYDLPSVTHSPVTSAVMEPLMGILNIRGIKTANLNLILDLYRNNLVRDDFSIFYSGLDSFDAAIKAGIKKNLDGMFTCTPRNSGMMYSETGDGSSGNISWHLNNILTLRNLFAREVIMPAYSYAMELLGCPGIYHPDYNVQVSDNLKEEIHDCMKMIKEI